jgi:hypothetical protein
LSATAAPPWFAVPFRNAPAPNVLFHIAKKPDRAIDVHQKHGHLKCGTPKLDEELLGCVPKSSPVEAMMK